MASLAKQDLQLGFQLRPAQLVMVHGAATKARAMGLHFTVTEPLPSSWGTKSHLNVVPFKKKHPACLPFLSDN